MERPQRRPPPPRHHVTAVTVAAVQRIAELALALSLKGVPLAAGPNERLAYIYQNQLTEEEFGRWSAAANTHAEVSDAALAALESADATGRGTTSRLSCSVETRELWFHGRVEHLRCFLNDQAKAPGGLGSSARSAVTTADDGTDGAVVAAAATAARLGSPGTPARPLMPMKEYRLRAAHADLITAVNGSHRHRSRLPPPECFQVGTNTLHLAANTAEFKARKDSELCFACTMGTVQRNQHFLACPLHGTQASAQQREDPAGRVKGATAPRAY